MNKLICLIFLCSFLGCAPIDIEEDILVEKTFYLNGTIDNEPYEIVAGANDILLDAQLEFEPTRHQRTIFQKTFVCSNNCQGFFELKYYWPEDVNEFENTFEEKYPNPFYNFTTSVAAERGRFVITYQNEQGIIYHSFASTNNSLNRMILVNHFPEGNKTEIKFDCDLINDAGDRIELRNFEGIVVL